MGDRVLHHELVTAPGESPERWLLALHGAFGSGRNWAGVIGKLVQRRQEWGGALLDLREHGRSIGMSGAATMASASNDLDGVSEKLGRNVEAVLAHSFGGKVAMRWANGRRDESGALRRRSRRALRQVWVIDMTPEAQPPEGEAWTMVQRLRRLPAEFESRPAAVAALEADGVSPPVASWMAMNLERCGEGVRWRFRLDDIESMLADFYATSLWEFVEDPPVGVAVHFVKASESNVLSDGAVERIEAAGEATGRVHLHHVEGGHWLNMDKPDALVDLLSKHL